MSANRVNWETINASPPTSVRLRFILPASSPKMRRSTTLSARRRTVASSSSDPAPTNNTRPGPMVSTRSAPPSSHRTEPEAARCTTSLTLPRALVDLGAEVRLGVDERVDVAESLVSMLQALCGRLREQRLKMTVQRFIQRSGGAIVIQMRAKLGLGNDLFYHAHREQVARRELELLSGLDLARIVTPDDRCCRLRPRRSQRPRWAPGSETTP